MLSGFLTSWLTTLAIEIAVLSFFLRHQAHIGLILLVGFFASTLTLPWLWFVAPNWLNHEQLLIYGEIGVVIVEAVVIGSWLRVNWLKSLLVSFLANFCSLLIGNLAIY